MRHSLLGGGGIGDGGMYTLYEALITGGSMGGMYMFLNER